MGEDYKVLEELLEVVGPSGFEDDVQGLFLKLMTPLVDKTYFDPVGNCYAEVEGNSDLPRVMFNAHADTVGFMIKHIDDKGFLFTNDLAGGTTTDYRNLPGSKLVVHSRKRNELLPAKFAPIVPIHMLSDDDLIEGLDRSELAIDIGARSLEQAKKYVKIGDYVVFESSQRYFGLNGNNWLEATNLDDRAGMYVMYEVARALTKSRAKNKAPVIFVSTVSEENGNGMAGLAAVHAKPDIAITLDVTPATDQIRDNNDDTIAKNYGRIYLDEGPSIARGFGVDDKLFLYLENICERKRIPYQVEVGGSGTENEFIQLRGKGAKSSLVSIPARYCHTPIETISLNDLENTIKVCLEAYRGISRGLF